MYNTSKYYTIVLLAHASDNCSWKRDLFSNNRNGKREDFHGRLGLSVDLT